MTDHASVTALIDAARQWSAHDPDPVTVGAVHAAIERRDHDELDALFGGRIAFGTAGLRAELGAGPRRMCRLVVRQTAAGLAAALLDDGAAAGDVIVVGRDARHGSEQFAADIADVVAAAGFRPIVTDGPVPTPLVAFATLHLGAVAGVVVTASHNPPRDNGVKVYWRDGAQITAPTDALIAGHIDRAAADGNPAGDPGDHRVLDDEVVAAYLSTVTALGGTVADTSLQPRQPLRLVTTALHGVGAVLLGDALAAAGFDDVHPVESQQTPDPDFPTVSFPNPEEPGALDAALELAAATGADLVLANDPDADRLAVAAPDASDGSSLTPLRGDELGAIIAHGLLAAVAAPSSALFATTVVSSQLLAKIADSAGTRFFETLTGFKWLCRPALEHPGLHQVLIYEEALGYAIGPDMRDKDGIAAAVVVATLAARWRSEGRTLRDVVDDLHRNHGVHLQDNFSVRFDGDDGMAAARAMGAAVLQSPPTDISGVPVARSDRPASDVLRLFTDAGDRVVIRPSGTEPKLKFYCEAVEPPDADLEAARDRAAARLARIGDGLRQFPRPPVAAPHRG